MAQSVTFEAVAGVATKEDKSYARILNTPGVGPQVVERRIRELVDASPR